MTSGVMPVGRGSSPSSRGTSSLSSAGGTIMAKQSRVVIYQVDGAGSTGARVGEGSLVDPRLVFVHPPLSDTIAGGRGPRRFRVGIRSDADGTPFVAVADGLEDPVVIGTVEDVGPLVGLILDGTSGAPCDRLNGVRELETVEQLVTHAVPRLRCYSEDDWNCDRDDDGDDGGDDGGDDEGAGGVAGARAPRPTSFWCRFVRRLC